mmetsp:Transcript_9841/g.25049  ORF Transcript_9841/g.25049 Transcript_9841/m.25049 type:complete len:223 (-) Transcript_9841:4-672(-)
MTCTYGAWTGTRWGTCSPRAPTTTRPSSGAARGRGTCGATAVSRSRMRWTAPRQGWRARAPCARRSGAPLAPSPAWTSSRALPGTTSPHRPVAVPRHRALAAEAAAAATGIGTGTRIEAAEGTTAGAGRRRACLHQGRCRRGCLGPACPLPGCHRRWGLAAPAWADLRLAAAARRREGAATSAALSCGRRRRRSCRLACSRHPACSRRPACRSRRVADRPWA